MGDKVPSKNVGTMPPKPSQDDSKSKLSSSAGDASSQIETQRIAQPSLPSDSPVQRSDISIPNVNSNAYANQQYPYNMNQMAGALPDYGYGRQAARGGQTQFTIPQYQPAPQAPFSPAHFAPYPHPSYSQQYPPSPTTNPHPGFGASYPGQMRSGNIPAGQYGQPQVPYYYYHDPYSQSGSSPISYNTSQQFPAPQRSGAPAIISSQGESPRQQSGFSSSYPSASPLVGEGGFSRPPEAATTAIPRGPPRKPKQSGHALWVGNLPPGASIAALKDHFARGAKTEIESLFLIQKSNCAFVNYRTEEACEKAVARFHDSRFQGVRLVCRLRKSSTSAPGAPTGPGSAAAVIAAQPSKDKEAADVQDGTVTDLVDGVDGEESDSSTSQKQKSTKHLERFFIVKSLTLQDLEQSVRSGIWATQSHNEEALNKAYKTAENVYLIFSANKSGEYFGYARMASPITENATELYGEFQRTEVPDTMDSPRTIPTPATEYAPKGHIIDDSARGTIFWEAEHSDDEAAEEETLEATDIDTESPTWGKAFKIEWISTTRVPFYRTRGLRNPWNSNREVKIARDGTEIEPSVGNRLLHLFHRSGSVAGPSSHPPPA